MSNASVKGHFLRLLLSSDRHTQPSDCLTSTTKWSVSTEDRVGAPLGDGSLKGNHKSKAWTRSTWTVHTSAKARLTSATIRTRTRIRMRIRIRDPDRHQNLTFVHWPIANLPRKFHASPFGSFCAKLLTDKQTDKQQRLHILLGGGKNFITANYCHLTSPLLHHSLSSGLV